MSDVRKLNFVSNTMQVATKASAVFGEIRNLLVAYQTMGFAPGGSREIAGADLEGEAAQITAEELHAGLAALAAISQAVGQEQAAAVYAISLTVQP